MAAPERCSAETPCPPAATVSSLKSEDSTEQLIAKTPQRDLVIKTKDPSVSRSGGRPRRRVVVWLGLAQVVLGALLVGAGALALVRGAALARVGAGLWAGCVAVAAGAVGVLAGVDECCSLHRAAPGGGPLLSAFLALSLLGLAGAHAAAVLAATGLHRDAMRANAHADSPIETNTFQEEMSAWARVLANAAVLACAGALCVASAASAWLAARRACSCLRARKPFDHNQFEPHKPPALPLPAPPARDLCAQLEGKLQGENKKEEAPEYGSANSKEKLVTRWLGRHGTPPPGAGRRARAAPGVRKPPPRAPLVLLPAHAASTLGRMPACVMVPPPRYATLPLPPPQYAHATHPHATHPHATHPHATHPHVPHPHAPHPHAPIYYPLHDARVRRRRSPREHGRGERRRRDGRERDSQLTRSLERIHRKRRAGAERERVTDADLKRTYTGLDRAYAEQFIAVCDETRHALAGELPSTQLDSLASASSDTSRAS